MAVEVELPRRLFTVDEYHRMAEAGIVTWHSLRSNCGASGGSSPRMSRDYWRHGMGTSEGRPGERAKDVRFTDDTLVVDLLDGRTISVPLVWYPRLLSATPTQRANWRLAGGGFGIHWPDVDEDLSTAGLLRGAPAPRGSMAVGRKRG
jgi:hypothetical protein